MLKSKKALNRVRNHKKKMSIFKNPKLKKGLIMMRNYVIDQELKLMKIRSRINRIEENLAILTPRIEKRSPKLVIEN